MEFTQFVEAKTGTSNLRLLRPIDIRALNQEYKAQKVPPPQSLPEQTSSAGQFKPASAEQFKPTSAEPVKTTSAEPVKAVYVESVKAVIAEPAMSNAPLADVPLQDLRAFAESVFLLSERLGEANDNRAMLQMLEDPQGLCDLPRLAGSALSTHSKGTCAVGQLNDVVRRLDQIICCRESLPAGTPPLDSIHISTSDLRIMAASFARCCADTAAISAKIRCDSIVLS